MKIYGYIYLITNLINGKFYIGQTVQTIEERFDGHISDSKKNGQIMVICRAIKKHGIKNFKIEQIDVAYNQEELNLIEGVYISWFKSLAPNGYNIKEIINGKGRHSKESIEKMKIKANKPERLKRQSEIGKLHRGKIVKNSKSKYIGVCIISKNKYRSTIHNNKKFDLGVYNIESNAAKAYDIAALKHFGLDCNLNFPELRQDYINNKIKIIKNTIYSKSKSGIKGVLFRKKENMWRVIYFDIILNKNKTKHFKTLEEAIKFKELGGL